MSLLQQDSTGLDDAARGEELTKGTSHVVWAAIAATIVVSIAVAVYMIAGEKPPAAQGDIVEIWAHPQHTVTSGVDASGAPVEQQQVDQILVFTHARLKNQSDHPVILTSITANATLDDGIHSSYAANKSDYDRVWVAYPDLPVPHGAALSPVDLKIDPGQTVDGTFITSFKMSQQQWDARKKLDYTFSFRYQPSLVVTPQAAVTVR